MGYMVHRKDRTSSGGGIMTYVRSDIHLRTRPDLECQTEHVESLVLEASFKQDKWLLITVYSPHKKHELELVRYLCKVYDNEIGQYKEILCMGDINIDLSLPGTHFQNDIIDVYGLSNLIVPPTCHKSNRSTLLDLILVTNKRFYLDSLNINYAYSDFHNITGCITRMHLQKQEPRKITYIIHPSCCFNL
jgi:exonuclease III